MGNVTVAPGDFRDRVRVLLELQGTVLTEQELSHIADRYPRCGGKGAWDVRAYARRSGMGAREYRVVRGGSVQDVYCSAEPVNAAAVRQALNEMETQPAP